MNHLHLQLDQQELQGDQKGIKGKNDQIEKNTTQVYQTEKNMTLLHQYSETERRGNSHQNKETMIW